MSCRKQTPNIFSVRIGNGHAKPKLYPELPRSKITIWTSGYGCRCNFLPVNIAEIYSHYHQDNNTFELPMINAKHGRKLNDDFLQEYENHFQNLSAEEQHVSILLLGNENVSTLPTREVNGQNDVIFYTHKILQMHLGSIHPCLVLTLVPEVSQEQLAFLTARQTDHQLGVLVKSFFNTPSGHLFGVEYTAVWFRKIGGPAALHLVLGDFQINPSFYQENRIDLNPQGAYMLAGRICDAAERIIINYRMELRK